MHMEFNKNDQAGRKHEPDGGPAVPAPVRNDETRAMTASECWELLGESGIGHLALRAQPVGVDIVPVNYLVVDGQLLFKSGPGAKLAEVAEHPYVALQIEHLLGAAWFSVVVKGRAERLDCDEDIESSGILDHHPTQPGDKFNYVRIVPDVVLGRTFPDGPRASTARQE